LQKERAACPSESPRVENNDWRDDDMRRELPFNSFWIGRAGTDDVITPSCRAQP
jgi:hypothetical protein